MWFIKRNMSSDFKILIKLIKDPRNVKKAIKEPRRFFKFIMWAYKFIRNSLLIKKIKKDGAFFYKYNGKLYPAYLKDGKARFQYIFPIAKKYCKGKGLDIGAGENSFPRAIPIENEKYQNAYKLDKIKDKSLNFVFSSHCLEHLDRWQEALALWIKKLGKNGILFLYLPHQSMKLWRRGSPWIGKDHKWAPTYNKIAPFLLKHNMKILDYEKDKDKFWSFYIIAKKR
jgi:SAM-dependent methyltransferase